MKLSVRKKQNKNTNKRIIGRLIIIMLLISVGVLSAFYLVETQDIRIRSEAALRAYIQNEASYYEDRSFMIVYELYVGENMEDYYYYDEVEENLTDYYLSNRERFETGKVYQFSKRNMVAFFVPLNASKRGSYVPEGAEGMLLYTDVGYYFGLLWDNTLIIAIILAVVCILLFIASRYTIRKLDAKDAEMKNFFANASHELKTPLMAIRGNVDGIKNGYVQTRAGCEVIEKETERMSGLISSILDLSKVDSGAVEPDMEDNDIREIIYDAVSSVQMEAQLKGLEIELNLPDPIFRLCDESLLYSAFSNILTNAVRYAESRILVQTEKQPKGKVQIRFINDGAAISEEDRLHIFDRFYKGEKGQNGLGMALAQEYVKLHGSEIQIHVQDGRTVFEILL